jgi:acyl carrier protein/NAD(P)-dependent dehydrogenase (short-subunit alcohol dehydrogenase family)
VPDALDTARIEHVTQSLLAIVSDKTGYPVEMLEPEMDMESDLGIDSIKRVEILGAMQEQFPDLPGLSPEELAELRTLGQIGDHMLAAYAGAQGPATAAPAPAQPAAPVPDAPAGLQRSEARLKSLPTPDVLELGLPAGFSCLLTDDGTPLTGHLAQSLTGMGWRVVVLSFPQSTIATQATLPQGVQRVALQNLEEAHLQQTFQNITATHGTVGAFIHLHPPASSGNAGTLFSETEKAIVRHVFLMARSLKDHLHAAAAQGRGHFVTVARLDGSFGLAAEGDFGAIGGGLFGLTKTLNLEWEPVFCRAIDLSPGFGPADAAQSVIAELQDPNRLITEVGYGSHGRATLVGL